MSRSSSAGETRRQTPKEIDRLSAYGEDQRAAEAVVVAGGDGVYLCVDVGAASNLADNVDHPLGPLLYSASTLHCMTVSLAQGGPGLGTCWGQETALRMLAGAGFRDVEVKKIE